MKCDMNRLSDQVIKKIKYNFGIFGKLLPNGILFITSRVFLGSLPPHFVYYLDLRPINNISHLIDINTVKVNNKGSWLLRRRDVNKLSVLKGLQNG